VQDAVELLRTLGHVVEEQSPAIDGNALSVSYLHMYFGHVHSATQAAKRAGASGRDFEVLTRILATLGANTASGTFVSELNAWNTYARALGQFHARYDMLLTPTAATPAPVHGAADLPAAQEWVLSVLERSGIFGLLAKMGLLEGMIQQIARDSLSFVPFTQLSNLTGTPSMSVPLYTTTEGLPVGVQFMARFGAEDQLLQLASQLEAERSWSQKLPRWVLPKH
jgi:amidase